MGLKSFAHDAIDGTGAQVVEIGLVESRDDFPRLASQAADDEPAVEAACCLRIELVDSLDRECFEPAALAFATQLDA